MLVSCTTVWVLAVKWLYVVPLCDINGKVLIFCHVVWLLAVNCLLILLSVWVLAVKCLLVILLFEY
jgi:hypothetical protein